MFSSLWRTTVELFAAACPSSPPPTETRTPGGNSRAATTRNLAKSASTHATRSLRESAWIAPVR